MTAVRQFAPAKVNLFLHVGDKRADGYHDLCSLAVFPDIGDEVSVAPATVIPGERPSRETRDPSGGAQDHPISSSMKNGSRRAAHSRLGRDDAMEDGLSLTVVGPFAKDLEEAPPSSLRDTPPAFGEGRLGNLVLRAAEALRHQALAMGRPVPGAQD
jgi:hypothetical protein